MEVAENILNQYIKKETCYWSIHFIAFICPYMINRLIMLIQQFLKVIAEHLTRPDLLNLNNDELIYEKLKIPNSVIGAYDGGKLVDYHAMNMVDLTKELINIDVSWLPGTVTRITKLGPTAVHAIQAVFIGIVHQPKYILDADIAKCFDRIDHWSNLCKRFMTIPPFIHKGTACPFK
ncbi:hypothetical protein [Pelosinus fermentans]|uniref:Uncharacterized protein n=1 Tax=Pelosinus fermentans JBW45 TaxID=1192197 RepID=I9NRW6_9FIRM|nr:hypothetical protein [Pelosinus fermentans]AJQ27629.1 hypothetical protein JBW_02283 [Pelosinus fermentans JBW45]